MKKALFTLLLIPFFVQAQKHEISIGYGSGLYYGDLNAQNDEKYALNPFTEFTKKNLRPSYCVGYRYYFEGMFSLALRGSYLHLGASDADNQGTDLDNLYKHYRNLSFYTDVMEASASVAFEPFRTGKRWKNRNFLLSPYAEIGLGIFKFNPKTNLAGQEIELRPLYTEGQGLIAGTQTYSLYQMSQPISLGIKCYTANRKFSFAVEACYRFTSTDYLDDVSHQYVDPSIFSALSSDKQTLAIQLNNRSAEADPTGTISSGYYAGQIRGNNRRYDAFMTIQAKIGIIF
jgi:hypothetical protein